MLKRIGSVILLLGTAAAQICIRPLIPFDPSVYNKVVLEALAKKGVEAAVCGPEKQDLEVWYYPLGGVVRSDTTQVWVNAQPTPGGVVGDVSTYTPTYEVDFWVLSVHVHGEDLRVVDREENSSLKSGAGDVGKYLAKQIKRYNQMLEKEKAAQAK